MPRSDVMVVWRGLVCRVRHTPDHLLAGWSRVEVWAMRSPSPPLPGGRGGYARLETEESRILAAGGVVAFVATWLTAEAASDRYQADLARWRQRDLFK